MPAGRSGLNRLPVGRAGDYAGGMPLSNHSQPDPSMRIRVAPEEIAFWHWPLRDRGLGAWLALAVPFVVGGFAAWMSSPAMGWLTFGALLLVSWRNWLPVWFEVGPSGVTQQVFWRRRRIPWIGILHYHVGLHGVLLFPDAVLTRLSPLRGLYLHWGKNRQAVLANFEYYLQSWGSRTAAGYDSTRLQQPVS